MESSTPITWTVWRIDDNANTFVVRSGLNKEEAELLAASMEAHGHKQMYWVAPDETQRPDIAKRSS
ncbi:MAG: hypothetical protein MUF06_00760 [Pirellulaceae bacterium]|nr:hypothetical protein [Pirellulaceae bacterium]